MGTTGVDCQLDSGLRDRIPTGDQIFFNRPALHVGLRQGKIKVLLIRDCAVVLSVLRSPLGIRNPFFDLRFMRAFLAAMGTATVRKILSGRYLQDVWFFCRQHLLRRVQKKPPAFLSGY